jgi:hypothetical protein
MTVSVNNAADVINLALARVGYRMRIGSLYDGSEASKIGLTLYAQTRDEVLRESDWGFAQRTVTLTLLKTAPTGGYVPPTVWTSSYPPLPWIYEYAYPADCIKIRALKNAPILIPNFDPRPKVFNIANDSSLSPAAKVILTNVTDAIAVYTGRVTDPATWEPLFVEALVASLARRLAPSLASLDVEKMEAQDEQTETMMAADKQG